MGNFLITQREAFKKYSSNELDLLERMFKDLARRSPGKTMDKATFTDLFQLPGIMGERLFKVFDISGDGKIDFEEFITGLASYSRGNMEDKISMLFKMYDLNGQNAVDKEELATMLYSLVTPASSIIQNAIDGHKLAKEQGEEKVISSPYLLPQATQQTVQDLVTRAFETCDVDDNGNLGYDEFKRWTHQTPDVVQSLERVLANAAWVKNEKALPSRYSPGPGTLRGIPKLSMMKSSNGRKNSFMEDIDGLTCTACNASYSFCVGCGEALYVDDRATNRLKCSFCDQTLELKFCQFCSLPFRPADEETIASGSLAVFEKQTTSTKDGLLWKRGARLHQWQSRLFVIRGNFMYKFKSSDKKGGPERVYYMQGCFIEYSDTKFQNDGYYGFKIVQPNASESNKKGDEGQTEKTYYARSKDSMESWVKELRKAAQTVPLNQSYNLGKELGRGHFSRVREGVHVETGVKRAIKVIEKKKIDSQQKESLRTEIAIMKLVHHPHIIRFEEIYETRRKIYIVMNLVQGGDLFDRIVARKRYSEENARIVVWRILDALRYLHARGIVHRDLKPENILCATADDDTNILLSDFGLSQFATPSEVMNIPCGTLAYVAPEVLKMEGYSRSVDLWSLGCIAFLLLRGHLPFDAKTKEQIIERTLHSPVKYDAKWDGISEEAKEFVRKLLIKNPRERLVLQGALKHPWFDALSDEIRADIFLLDLPKSPIAEKRVPLDRNSSYSRGYSPYALSPRSSDAYSLSSPNLNVTLPGSKTGSQRHGSNSTRASKRRDRSRNRPRLQVESFA